FFEDPLMQTLLPMRPLSMDAARQLEGVGIEFEDRDAAKRIRFGIEYAVVINLIALAEDPFAIGLQIGLRRLALDLVAQDLLLAVGVRDVDLIEDEKHRSEDGSDHDNRYRRAIDAEA